MTIGERGVVLVTGGCGYVGSVVVPELLALGEQVRIVDNMWFRTAPPAHPNLELIEGDLRRIDPAWLDGVRGVIHLAGLSNDPTADFAPHLNAEVNVQAARRLAETTALRARAEGREIRFVAASSCSVYYCPTRGAAEVEAQDEESLVAPVANYSKTKRMAEMAFLDVASRHEEFCPVMLRKGTLFGLAPKMRFDLVVNAFTLHAWKKRRLTVNGSGEAWRPLLHVRDAADAYIYCLLAPTEAVRGRIFNVSHKNYRVLELAHWVTEVLERNRGVQVDVRRDRSSADGARSYYVLAEKISKTLGFRAEKGITQGVLEIWDALESGRFGDDPAADPYYFNIRWFKERGIADREFAAAAPEPTRA